MRELALLQHIYGANAGLPAHVSIPPGDDMGAITLGDQTVLVTVDQVADGVHVDLASAPLHLVGRKAINRNLSDVAAMAAKPIGAVVAGSLPRDFGEARANDLFDAMRATAESHGCPLIGGDLSVWDHPLLLSVTVLAEPAGIDPVLRRGARPGDIICVTGHLGGSLVPVAFPAERGANARAFYTHHLSFEPRIDFARALAGDATTRPHSMIDLSDGLAKDLRHLLEPGGLAGELDVSSLPRSEAAHLAAEATGRPAWQHALTDGEDYELCFTLSPDAAEAVTQRSRHGDGLGVPITAIGRVTEVANGDEVGTITLRHADGRRERFDALGWEHQT